MRVHRFLSLVTFDIRLAHLLTRVQNTLSATVQTWYDRYRDHGASLYFQHTRMDPTFPLFADRWSLCQYLCAQSPKLRYLCRVLYNTVRSDAPDQGKLLIFVSWPPEQWIVTMLLRNLGIPSMALTSALSAAEKAAITNRFDDPDDPSRVLVCTFRGTAFGVNLQTGCHKLVMMSIPDNINTLLQTIGRIHRLGQSHVQEVWILGTDHSYDQLLQSKAVKKIVVQLIGEADLSELRIADSERYRERLRQHIGAQADMADDQVDEQVEAIGDSHLLEQVDVMIRQLLGMRCSRLTWDNKDLFAKDRDPEHLTPGHVKAMPASPRSSARGKGRREPSPGESRNCSFQTLPPGCPC
jgi:superfamily II DNA/RNA helicase